jgi:hypothetical protein
MYLLERRKMKIRAKDQLEEWERLANEARQPDVFYKEYNEGTMRAMQALLSKETADAKRYRYLRDTATRMCEPLYNIKTKEIVPNAVRAIMSLYLPERPAFYADPDAAIDAAMKDT